VGATVLSYSNPSMIDNMGAYINYSTGYSTFIANGKAYSQLDKDTDLDADYTCGAAMMIKREVIERVGLLPEYYFLYCEEEDYCVRAKKLGYRIICSAKATVLHKASSTVKCYRGLKNYYFHRSRFLFLRVHAKPQQCLLAIGHSALAIFPYYLYQYTVLSRDKPLEGLHELQSFMWGMFDGIRFKTGCNKKLHQAT
jgi:GT2 family glycosyltransferase